MQEICAHEVNIAKATCSDGLSFLVPSPRCNWYVPKIQYQKSSYASYPKYREPGLFSIANKMMWL